MAMLSTSDLAAARADFDATFEDTAVISRATFVADGQGGGSATAIAIGTVECRVAPATKGQETMTSDRVTALVDVYIAMPALTDVRETDTVTVDAAVYEVQSVRAPRTNEIVRRVEATEVR